MFPFIVKSLLTQSENKKPWAESNNLVLFCLPARKLSWRITRKIKLIKKQIQKQIQANTRPYQHSMNLRIISYSTCTTVMKFISKRSRLTQPVLPVTFPLVLLDTPILCFRKYELGDPSNRWQRPQRVQINTESNWSVHNMDEKMAGCPLEAQESEILYWV